MTKATQISAYISEATRERLERYSRATGVKKGFLLEAALQHHLQALETLPLELIVPTQLVVTRRSGEALLSRINAPARPTTALRRLMQGDGD